MNDGNAEHSQLVAGTKVNCLLETIGSTLNEDHWVNVASYPIDVSRKSSKVSLTEPLSARIAGRGGRNGLAKGRRFARDRIPPPAPLDGSEGRRRAEEIWRSDLRRDRKADGVEPVGADRSR